jgi:dihydrofolate reductase
VFSSIPYQQGQGWGIGKNTSIPWYSSEERIEFSKLVKPYWRIVGRHSVHKVAYMEHEKTVYLARKQSQQLENFNWSPELFLAMRQCKGNPALALGGRRTIKEALKWANFVIIHEMKNYVFCNQWVDFGGVYGEWRQVSKREFRDFHQLRFVRSDFPTDSTADELPRYLHDLEARVKNLGTG